MRSERPSCSTGFPSQIIGILPADFQIARLDADVWEPHDAAAACAVVKRGSSLEDFDRP